MKVHSGTVSSGPASLGPAGLSSNTGKDTLEDQSAISANGSVAEEDTEKSSANQDKNCLSDEPMDTTVVAEAAE